MVEAPKVPKVYCPKEKRKVPIWWCFGSFMQERDPCQELIEATVNFPENFAKVKCKAKLAVRNTKILIAILITAAVIGALLLGRLPGG